MVESVTGLAVLLLQGLAVFAVGIIAYGVYVLTHPTRRTYASAVARGRPGHPGEMPGAPRPYESWTFRSRGLDLPVWDLPGEAPSGPTVIFVHGWGDSRIGGLTRAPAFLARASRLIMWDLPGHGEAPGTCALGTREPDDLLALIERVHDPRRGMVIFGWSLGAVIAIAGAARARGAVQGVIAEAPYRLAWTPARNVMRLRGLPWTWNIAPKFAVLGVLLRVGVRWRGFDAAQHAARLDCPLLVLHGTQDAVCPAEDGRAIAASAARGEYAEIAGGQHFGLWTEEPGKGECERAVGAFLDRLEARGV